MLANTMKSNNSYLVLKLAFAIMIATCLSTNTTFAQGNNDNDEAVGGIVVDPNGVLRNNPINLSGDILNQINNSLKNADADLNKNGLRVLSIRKLEKTIANHRAEGKPLPPSVKYLAGLQRIEYVMLSPAGDDVLIAGPGEGLTTAKDGSVVGAKSGMPPVQLQDLLVAMRTVQNARTGKGISVSIDPTEEGIRNIQKVMKKMTPSSFNAQAAKTLEEACGPQNITLNGVPKDSRFSQILVAADYKMKRLAMGLEATPEFLPSMLAMAQAKDKVLRKMSPRFWMEANYEPLAVNQEKSVWKLSGQGICTKTMEEYLTDNGKKVEKPNKFAKAWAAKMTDTFTDLSKAQPVFRELRNIMDLSVVAAIIARERLFEKVSLDAPAINGHEMVSLPKWNVPKTVPSECSYARVTRGMLVTTSGGVTVNSWSVVSNTVADSKLNNFADQAVQGQSGRWWWNAN